MQNKKVTAFIKPPKKIPLFLKIGIYIIDLTEIEDIPNLDHVNSTL